MNEPAVRLEEQIINLFSGYGTEIYQGWILKDILRRTVVWPLYGSLDQNISDRIQACEAIGRRRLQSCEFRIVENSNYYLASLLADNGYRPQCSYIVGEFAVAEGALSCERRLCRKKGGPEIFFERIAGKDKTEALVTENGSVIGIRRQELLYLPDGKLPCDAAIEDVLLLAAGHQVSRILVNIPENETWRAYYREAGFHRAYLYRCYQREEGDEIDGYTG